LPNWGGAFGDVPWSVTPERQAELIEKLASKIVELKLTAPAIFLLESSKPLSFIGSQALVFLQPVVQAVFPFKEYQEIAVMLEDRENVEKLIVAIEKLDAGDKASDKNAKGSSTSEGKAS
jgi:hypothetical protein